ncbi:helix-turn-helix transcriptional regulator [Acidaminococcus massiliensis]|uniref:helix-turn-helix transcriptional regulator n=1 Tax=Acidaminococcus massiliensis TaxID=1852375 RepID=UPI0022E64F0B|nr:helix-turn-helix transcriptional regulator [Acidaminococcus massiliensis]
MAQRILSYLTAHYGEKITLAQIAAYASYTESECCRIFKRFTGESIFAYLRELRLEQSVRLLDSTDQSISEIGENCGFRSPSYYIEAFRQQFHCTPFQYRKKKRT